MIAPADRLQPIEFALAALGADVTSAVSVGSLLERGDMCQLSTTVARAVVFVLSRLIERCVCQVRQSLDPEVLFGTLDASKHVECMSNVVVDIRLPEEEAEQRLEQVRLRACLASRSGHVALTCVAARRSYATQRIRPWRPW